MKTKPKPSEAQGRALSDESETAVDRLLRLADLYATASMQAIAYRPARLKDAARQAETYRALECAIRTALPATPTDAARAQEQAPQDAGALRDAMRDFQSRKPLLELLEMVLDDMTICIEEAGRDYQFQELSEETVAALWKFSNDYRKD